MRLGERAAGFVAMLGMYNLLCYEIDLDSDWVDETTFTLLPAETGSIPESMGAPQSARHYPWSSYLAWISVLLRQSHQMGARQLRLALDPCDSSLMQSALVRDQSGHDVRLEFVPMAPTGAGEALRAICMIAALFPWRRSGYIRYRYNGKRLKARCIRGVENELTIEMPSLS